MTGKNEWSDIRFVRIDQGFIHDIEIHSSKVRSFGDRPGQGVLGHCSYAMKGKLMISDWGYTRTGLEFGETGSRRLNTVFQQQRCKDPEKASAGGDGLS